MSLALGGCLPATPQGPAAPTADLDATAAVFASTLLAQTVAPGPLFTPTIGITFTPIPHGSPTAGTSTPTATASLTVTAASPTARTATPGATAASSGPVVIGELPANTPFGTIRLENRSKTGVSVSLHCTTNKGYQTIMEYDVYRRTIIEAPLGRYVYVVYIGGHKFVGSFTYGQASPLTITFYRDKVVVH